MQWTRDNAHSTQSDEQALGHEMAITARCSNTMSRLGAREHTLQHLGFALAANDA